MVSLQPRVLIDGVFFSAVGKKQLVEHVTNEIGAGRGGKLFTPNFQMLAEAERNADLRELINSSEVSTCDSSFLFVVSRLVKAQVPERIAGSDLMVDIVKMCVRADLRLAIVGGTDADLAAAGDRLRRENPGYQEVMMMGPSVSAFPTEQETRIVASAIRKFQPQVVILALGFPKQERLAAALQPDFPGIWFAGLGAAVAYFGGTQTRAPKIVQKFGLEWLWRFSQEPKRLFDRYFRLYARHLPKFFIGAYKREPGLWSPQ